MVFPFYLRLKRLGLCLSSMIVNYKNSRSEFIEESKSLNDTLEKKLESRKPAFWKKVFKFLRYSQDEKM